MTYEEYLNTAKQSGIGIPPKKDIWDDSRYVAIREAAKALGMKPETLRGMIGAS